MDPIKPDYYTRNGVACKDAMRPFLQDLSGIMAGYMFCALKYLWRFQGKAGAQDIAKAAEYCSMIYNELPDRKGEMEVVIHESKT